MSINPNNFGVKGIDLKVNNTLDGKEEQLVVREDDLIRNVKKTIRDRFGLDKDEYSLLYGDLLLEDDKCIGYYIIRKHLIKGVVSFIEIVPPSMVRQVNVNLEDGRTIVLRVKKTISIANIKEKIYDKIGLSPDDQRLLYLGEILEDDKTVDEYQIAENDVINVVTRSSGGMEVYAKTMDGEIVALEVTTFDRIIDIKRKIQKKIGLSPDEQKLVYEGRILEDDKSVDDYDINKYSVINVRNKPRGRMKVYAKTMDGEIVTLEVTETITIIDIKKKIQEKIGLSPDDQKLVYEGRILEDYKSINDYDINENSVIDVVYQLKGSGHKCVRVMIGDDGDILDVGYTIHTVSDVKMSLQEETGLSPNEQQLMYQERLLQEDDRIMEDDDPIITLLDKPREMFARTTQGSMIVLQVKLMDRIIDIKRMIQAKTGLPPYKQILRLSGTELSDDNMKVYRYKIATKSNIDVTEVSKNMVAILSDNMETIMIEINNDDRVINVKKRLEVKLGLPCGDQILKFQDEIMNDDDIMDSYIVRGLRDITISGSSPLETRGFCVVISNKTFSKCYDDRLGTEVDEDNIKNTFQTMGYGIEVYQNVSSSSMQRIIDETKKKINEEHRNMIVFVLSHGLENGVVMSDEIIVPFKNIWTPFSNEKFPKFAGKSKLFFFACCLGSNFNNAVPGASNSPVQYDCPPSNTGQVPAMGDFFLGYATCESYLACRYPSRGTIYIECLCKVVRDYPLWNISDIHQEVQSKLTKEVRPGPKSAHIQMPHCDSMLREHAYFHDNVCYAG